MSLSGKDRHRAGSLRTCSLGRVRKEPECRDTMLTASDRVHNKWYTKAIFGESPLILRWAQSLYWLGVPLLFKLRMDIIGSSQSGSQIYARIMSRKCTLAAWYIIPVPTLDLPSASNINQTRIQKRLQSILRPFNHKTSVDVS